MAFPPQFLDELRARVGLAALVGRRVKLTRKGREHSGLCPFHNEKTPSFTVSEEKGFFHCFGCGAHGDVIGFVMRSENLSFPEAVERLADEAGIAVPVMSPAERETARKQASLYQVMEAACAFFESNLFGAQGREALAYLRGRGLDDEAMARFRIGYAPDSRGALKTALTGKDGIEEAQLIEGGLLIRPDDGGRAPYDRFRGRVTFPISDRRGRVIAFGARALGDAQPKYLNSPDTPLFHKGQQLYGMAVAFPAARKSRRLVVAEGYMDVIALARAGIEEAVAPLGTALTEQQIGLLWRMTDEPVLCFDGDAAGQRAAARAAERALPLLTPGKSLRFVALPAGEDPDTLIASQGVDAMNDLIENARPLDQIVWEMETAGQRIDTPERIAGLEHRLEQRAFAIADQKVQYQYLNSLRQRVRALARPAPRQGFNRSYDNRNAARHGHGQKGFGPRPAPPRPVNRLAAKTAADTALGRGAAALPRDPVSHPRERAVLATLVNHWELLDEFAETLGTLNFFDPALDKLRQEILLLYAQSSDLDSEAVARHLMETGGSEGLQAVLSPGVYVSARSARADSDSQVAKTGLLELIHGMRLDEAQKNYNEQPTEENFARLQECQASKYQSLRGSV